MRPDVVTNAIGPANGIGGRRPEETLGEAAEVLALGRDITEDMAKDLTQRLVEWVMGGRSRGTGRGRGWGAGLMGCGFSGP